MEEFFDKDSSLPFGVMITFPSMKDRSWEEQHPDKITCQMLVVTNYDWFKNVSGEGVKEWMEMGKLREKKSDFFFFFFFF